MQVLGSYCRSDFPYFVDSRPPDLQEVEDLQNPFMYFVPPPIKHIRRILHRDGLAAIFALNDELSVVSRTLPVEPKLGNSTLQLELESVSDLRRPVEPVIEQDTLDVLMPIVK